MINEKAQYSVSLGTATHPLTFRVHTTVKFAHINLYSA